MVTSETLGFLLKVQDNILLWLRVRHLILYWRYKTTYCLWLRVRPLIFYWRYKTTYYCGYEWDTWFCTEGTRQHTALVTRETLDFLLKVQDNILLWLRVRHLILYWRYKTTYCVGYEWDTWFSTEGTRQHTALVTSETLDFVLKVQDNILRWLRVRHLIFYWRYKTTYCFGYEWDTWFCTEGTRQHTACGYEWDTWFSTEGTRQHTALVTSETLDFVLKVQDNILRAVTSETLHSLDTEYQGSCTQLITTISTHKTAVTV